MMGDNKSEKFFKVLHDRMKEAQTEIKATVSVNVGEMTHKANEKELENGEASSQSQSPSEVSAVSPDLLCTVCSLVLSAHRLSVSRRLI